MTTTTTRRPRLNKAQKKIILAKVREGLNGKEVAEDTGLAYHQVARFLKTKKHRKYTMNKSTAKNPLNRRPPTPEMVAQIRSLVGEGKTGIEIAKKLGISYTTVSRYSNPDYRTKRNYHAYRKAAKAAVPEVKSQAKTLIEEIKAEIRAEIKAELLKEMLGR